MLEQRIKKVFSQVFGILEEEVTMNTSKDTIESWDSLNHMTLISALEEEFSITFSDDQVVEMLNFQLIKAVLNECGVNN